MCSLWSVLSVKLNHIYDSKMVIFLGTLSDQTIGIINIADYLIYWMNRRNIHSYVRFLKLDKPSDDITEVLIKGAVSLNFIFDTKCPDTG